MYPRFLRYDYTLAKAPQPVLRQSLQHFSVVKSQEHSLFGSRVDGMPLSVQASPMKTEKKVPVQSRTISVRTEEASKIQNDLLNAKQKSVQLLLELQDLIIMPNDQQIPQIIALRNQIEISYAGYKDTAEQEKQKANILDRLDKIIYNLTSKLVPVSQAQQSPSHLDSKIVQTDTTIEQTAQKHHIDTSNYYSASPPKPNKTLARTQTNNICDFFKQYQKTKSEFLNKSFKERTEQDIQLRSERLGSFEVFCQKKPKRQPNHEKYV